jgi:anaerobic magnesium-protoporphyrin IX monomethyl ester cyclase
MAQFELRKSKRRLRVLLVQPPATHGVKSLLPQVDEGKEGIGYKPPIGLLLLATTIKRYSDHEVRIIDCIAEKLSIETTVSLASDFKPDIVGITAWSDFWYPAYTIGKLIKQTQPEVHLVYGGPHVGIYPEITLSLSFVDSVIVGDGEYPFLNLCNMIAEDATSNTIPGLHFKQWGVAKGELCYYVEKQIDEVPIPDRTFLDIKKYSSVLGKSSFTTTMITSRGCPNSCTFCKLRFQKTLCRSAESILEEFRQIEELGIGEVEIYDDTFTWSERRLLAICEGLIKQKNSVKWAVRDRVSNADPEVLKLMNRAGCNRIHYGVESGVERILKRIKKNITLEQARNAVMWAKNANMTVLAYFMFGNLDETIEDMHKTIAFAIELDPHYCEFSITIPYPGTELYREALSAGIIQNDFWLEFAKQPQADFEMPRLIENIVSLQELIGMRDLATRKFYFRLSYVINQLLQLKSIPELARKAKMGIQLFSSFLRKSR